MIRSRWVSHWKHASSHNEETSLVLMTELVFWDWQTENPVHQDVSRHRGRQWVHETLRKSVGGKGPDGSAAWATGCKGVDIEWWKQYGDANTNFRIVSERSVHQRHIAARCTFAAEGMKRQMRLYQRVTVSASDFSRWLPCTCTRMWLLLDTPYGRYRADSKSTFPWILIQFFL
jgi:hypothetical protein